MVVVVIIMEKLKEKIKVKCPKEDCGYEWETKSPLMFLTCVSCQRKFRRHDNKQEDSN